MYCIYANIGGILMVNVIIYSIHGSYGYSIPMAVVSNCDIQRQIYPGLSQMMTLRHLKVIPGACHQLFQDENSMDFQMINDIPGLVNIQKTDGKITMLLMGKSTISMVIFNSYVTNYQRVDDQLSYTLYPKMLWMWINVDTCWWKKQLQNATPLSLANDPTQDIVELGHGVSFADLGRFGLTGTDTNPCWGYSICRTSSVHVKDVKHQTKKRNGYGMWGQSYNPNAAKPKPISNRSFLGMVRCPVQDKADITRQAARDSGPTQLRSVQIWKAQSIGCSNSTGFVWI